MPTIKNSTLLEECKRLATPMEWDKGAQWNSKRMAVAVIRTILTELGAKEYLGDDMRESRAEIVEIIACCFTAPINFRREYLTPSGLAPEMPKADKAQAAKELELA